MPKYYFTYGTNPAYPFQGGWTEVTAPDERKARNLFRMFHPDSEGLVGTPNCADIYTEDKFMETDMLLNGNFGLWCQEEITVSRNLVVRESATEITNMTNFEKITESPEALEEFLSSLPCTNGPWYKEFSERLCAECEGLKCQNCPLEESRNPIKWWLNIEACERTVKS